MEYHGISDARGSAWISVETQGGGTALECLRYDGEAAWYDGGMTETGVAGGPLWDLWDPWNLEDLRNLDVAGTQLLKNFTISLSKSMINIME